jgi:hypothetical protein
VVGRSESEPGVAADVAGALVAKGRSRLPQAARLAATATATTVWGTEKGKNADASVIEERPLPTM